MTKKLADAAAAVLVIEHGGREYSFSPLTIADLGALERWMETLPIERARRRIAAWGPDITPEQRAEIIAKAEEAAAKSTAMSVDSAQLINSVEGTVYLLYLALRGEQPDITREQVAKMVKPDQLEEWQDKLDRLAGLAGDDETDPTQAETAKPETESPSTGAVSTEP